MWNFDFEALEEEFARAAAEREREWSEQLWPAPEEGRRIRILGLHGGGSNAHIMEYQTKQLRKILGDRAEFTFLNGCHPWTSAEKPKQMLLTLANGTPFYNWCRVNSRDTSNHPQEERLLDPALDVNYEELAVAVEKVLGYIREYGPFDAILGCAEGSLVSHLLAGTLQARGEDIPWKVNIIFNGMPATDPKCQRLFESPLSQPPAVMVFGRKNIMSQSKASQVAMYSDCCIIEHDEGSQFPTLQPGARHVYEEVARQILVHCGTPLA